MLYLKHVVIKNFLYKNINKIWFKFLCFIDKKIIILEFKTKILFEMDFSLFLKFIFYYAFIEMRDFYE